NTVELWALYIKIPVHRLISTFCHTKVVEYFIDRNKFYNKSLVLHIGRGYVTVFAIHEIDHKTIGHSATNHCSFYWNLISIPKNVFGFGIDVGPFDFEIQCSHDSKY